MNKWLIQMNKRDPLVFGDPEAPMTVGNFVRWLEEQFDPHDERDENQSKDIKAVNIAVLGNGNPKNGMQYKVDQMWDIAQRIEHFFSAGKMIWLTIVAILMAVAAAASIGNSLKLW